MPNGVCFIFIANSVLAVLLFSVRVETDLRGDVIWRPAESPRGHTFKYPLLAHPKICQLTVTVLVKKNIVQF